MVSHEHRFIFIHIPKSAGTSVEALFGHNKDLGGRNAQDHRPLRSLEPIPLGQLPNLLTNPEDRNILKGRLKNWFGSARNPRTSGRVSRQQFQDYLKFAIVRNPWAKAASWYTNVLRDPAHRKRLQIDQTLTFKAFLERFDYTIGLKPQTYWLKNFAGEYGLDRILRFERLANDFESLRKDLNVPRKYALPHKLRGDVERYSELYDDVTASMIAEKYAEEIAAFDYRFEDLA